MTKHSYGSPIVTINKLSNDRSEVLTPSSSGFHLESELKSQPHKGELTDNVPLSPVPFPPALSWLPEVAEQ